MPGICLKSYTFWLLFLQLIFKDQNDILFYITVTYQLYSPNEEYKVS